MTDRRRQLRMPTNDRPLNARRRATVGPLVATLLLLGVIAVVFLVVTTTASR